MAQHFAQYLAQPKDEQHLSTTKPPQDPSHFSPDNALERALGQQVRQYRTSAALTIADLAHNSGLSEGMLSKVENGLTSPSLATLQSIAKALNVPFTALFRGFEETSDAIHVAAGEGLTIQRKGTRAGHQYQLLGHSSSSARRVEPYLVMLTEHSDVFPMFQHPGIEFIYLLEGEVGYRHGNTVYHLKEGDSLYFDSTAPHGPEELIKLPVKMLAVICED